MNFLKVKFGLFSLLATLAVSVFLTSCEQSTIDIPDVVESSVDQQISEVPTDDAILPTEMEYEQRLVAKVQKDGHELQFLSFGDPEENNLLMIEALYGEAEENGGEAFYITSENTEEDVESKSAFDIFIKMTDSNIEVPEEIAMTAKNNQLELSGRTIMDDKNTLEILDDAANEQLENRDCTDEDIGWTGFRNTYCWGGAFGSNASDIRFCDSGTWINHIRNSYFDGWRTTKKVRVDLNVVCGDTRTSFYRWRSGRWNLEAEANMGISTGYSTARFDVDASGAKEYWRVHTSRPYNTGYFRISTRFY